MKLSRPVVALVLFVALLLIGLAALLGPEAKASSKSVLLGGQPRLLLASDKELEPADAAEKKGGEKKGEESDCPPKVKGKDAESWPSVFMVMYPGVVRSNARANGIKFFSKGPKLMEWTDEKGQNLITLYRNGCAVPGPNYKPDAASRQFWELLAKNHYNIPQ